MGIHKGVKGVACCSLVPGFQNELFLGPLQDFGFVFGRLDNFWVISSSPLENPENVRPSPLSKFLQTTMNQPCLLCFLGEHLVCKCGPTGRGVPWFSPGQLGRLWFGNSSQPQVVQCPQLSFHAKWQQGNFKQTRYSKAVVPNYCSGDHNYEV